MHLAFAQDIDVHMDEDGAEAAAAAAETDAMSGENDVNVEEFVRKMEESHFSRKLARRALEEVGPENIDNGNALYILICVALCSLCFWRLNFLRVIELFVDYTKVLKIFNEGNTYIIIAMIWPDAIVH